eukprot:5335290-Pyramimonas_sp.AAC.1
MCRGCVSNACRRSIVTRVRVRPQAICCGRLESSGSCVKCWRCTRSCEATRGAHHARRSPHRRQPCFDAITSAFNLLRIPTALCLQPFQPHLQLG